MQRWLSLCLFPLPPAAAAAKDEDGYDSDGSDSDLLAAALAAQEAKEAAEAAKKSSAATGGASSANVTTTPSRLGARPPTHPQPPAGPAAAAKGFATGQKGPPQKHEAEKLPNRMSNLSFPSSGEWDDEDDLT